MLELDKRFQKNVKGRFQKYAFQVGVLQDAPHKLPKRGTKSNFAGGPVRKKSSQNSGVSIAHVSKEMREHLGKNYLTAPFKKKGSDIIKFTNEFFRVVTGSSQKKRLENLLQAVVRNPILRGDYGSNSRITKKIKGFNRLMIDTAQLFKAIRARVMRNV